MAISRLGVEGYKSLKSVVWNPGALNVLIGPNGSGKSNLLRSFALIQQAVVSQDFPKAILQQGGLRNLLWDGQSKEIRWRLISEPLGLPRRSQQKPLLMYELAIEPSYFLASGYMITTERLRECYNTDKNWEFEILLDRDRKKTAFFDQSKGEFTTLPEPLPLDQTMLALSPFSNHTMWLFRSSIEGWGIYHDLQVHQGAQIRQAAIARVEKQISADGQNLIPVLHTLYTGDREFKRVLDDAMKSAFGSEYEELVFPPAEDRKINLRVRWRSLKTEQSAADLSDGTIRFLLLVTILANSSSGQLVAIDEPEVGLHPSMFPIIAEFAVAAAETRTVIFTTHSPQFLDAFGENVPATTVTRLVDGATQLSLLKGERLTHWLKDFTLGALFKSGELEEMD